MWAGIATWAFEFQSHDLHTLCLSTGHWTSLNLTFLIWKARGLPQMTLKDLPTGGSECTGSTVKVMAPASTWLTYTAMPTCSILFEEATCTLVDVKASPSEAAFWMCFAACPKGRGDMSLFLMGQICPAQTLTSFPFASIPQTLYPCFLMCIFLPQILLWNEVGCKILWAFWMMLFSPMILLSSPTFFLPHVFLSSFISASFFFFLPNIQLFASCMRTPLWGPTLLFKSLVEDFLPTTQILSLESVLANTTCSCPNTFPATSLPF